MGAPAKINFKVIQGGTFNEVLRWESSTKSYSPITNVINSAPVIITAVAHGIPIGWRAKVTNVMGMKEINSSDVYHTVTDITTDTVTINAVNSLGYSVYISGGVLEYNTPVDLTSMTARAQVRAKLDDPLVIIELTTENGGITIDNYMKTITLTISATDTAALTFNTAVYSLEIIDKGNVNPFCTGTLSLIKEVTR
jgi:hypothetical protein